MDRRELLKMIAMVTGSAVIGGEFFLSGCSSGTNPVAGFTAAHIALLDEVGETILPATNTPGAKAAEVGKFMQVFVSDCYSQKERDTFIKGMNALENACTKLHGKNFLECSSEQRTQLLLKLEEEAKTFNKELDESERSAREAAKKEKKLNEFVAAPRHYYTSMKQLTLLGFFSSKTGLTESLRYVPVPGKYDGALPYHKGDKAFS